MHLLPPPPPRILHLHLWVKFQEFPPLTVISTNHKVDLFFFSEYILSLNGIPEEEGDDMELINQRHNYMRGGGGGFITIIVLALGDELFEPARKRAKVSERAEKSARWIC